MSAYHLSPFRNRGWFRAAMVGAFLVLPLTAMLHALGYFGEGMTGLVPAGQFAGAGIVGVIALGLSTGWVLRGFAVRSRDDEEERDTARTGGAGAAAHTGGAAHAGARHAGPPAGTGRH